MKKNLPANRRGFTLIELLVSITIIGILAGIGLSTFTSAQIKGRDAKRKAHLRQISDALEAYFNDYKKYPDSDGAGSLADYTWNAAFQNDKGTIYMIKLPQDPTLGYSYYYESLDAGKKFQIYCRLENTQDINVNSQAYEGLSCGTQLCNYGVSSSNILPTTGRTLINE